MEKSRELVLPSILIAIAAEGQEVRGDNAKFDRVYMIVYTNFKKLWPPTDPTFCEKVCP